MVKSVIISGPSGVGKSKILSEIMKKNPGVFALCVSHTTRKPRPGENQGEHYCFVERQEMERMIKGGEFHQHIEFGGNLYGTSKKTMSDIFSSGKICILDVDLQGVKNFKQVKFDAKYILIIPPSLSILKEQLWRRGSEDEQSFTKRIERAKEDYLGENYLSAADVKNSDLFDHVIVNDQLEKSCDEFLLAIHEKSKEQVQVPRL